jgi:Ras-related protein Rab-6A
MKCKVVLLGDQSVGKTSVINRFIFDNFTGNEQVNLVLN